MRPSRALTAIILLAAVALSADPLQTTPQTKTLQVFSRETVVDVTVTDAKGNLIHGLKQSDFLIKEDGKPQPIKSFEEFGSATPAPAPISRKLPPNVYTNLPPAPATGPVNILLLDGLNTAPADSTDAGQVSLSFVVQKRVKEGAIQYLKSMPPGTQVIVLNLTRSLRILQGISTDPALLSAAVDTMEMDMDGRGFSPEQWCSQQDSRNRGTLEALQQIAADAIAIKGKKNLIWFSNGFPTITDPNLTTQPVCSNGANPKMPVLKGLEDQTASLLKTYALLAAAQVTVFPIGARALGSDIANPLGPGKTGGSFLVDPMQTQAYAMATGYEELSFEAMAEATGGAAYYNTNDLAGAVAKAVQHGASYYTISYVPPGQKYDYGHHKIKVSLVSPDQQSLHLAYRPTYDAVDPATIKPATGLTFAATSLPSSSDLHALRSLAMSRNMPTSQQLLFDVQILPVKVEPSTTPPAPPNPSNAKEPPIIGALDPVLKAKPLTRYAFTYTVPSRQIAFSDGDDFTHHGALEFDIVAYDAQAKLVTSFGQTVKIPLSEEGYQQFIDGPATFSQQLDLPSGPLFLRIGILDTISNKVGTLEIPLTVPQK